MAGIGIKPAPEEPRQWFGYAAIPLLSAAAIALGMKYLPDIPAAG